jgi:hypothetical protein
MYKIEFPEAVLDGANAKPFDPVCTSAGYISYFVTVARIKF